MSDTEDRNLGPQGLKGWYKNSIFYSLDVQSFMDGNGDGVGDFEGLANCLGYLKGLGVDCLWLLPIFDSPDRDNGYDVRDYFSLHHHLGNYGDFAHFLEEAENHAIRVLVDLPVNHTSAEHPWFQQARSDPDSHYHHYYIWCDEPPEDGEEKLILGEEQGGNWTHVPELGKYYYHTFYEHQPDLNFANPAVRHEIKKIMRFWLRQGIDGFRIDAAGHMIEEKGSMRFEGPPNEGIKELRAFVEAHNPSGVLLAEVDEEPEHFKTFIAGGRGLHLVLNFYLCNYLYLAMARQSGKALEKALGKLPETPAGSQWGNFLRNHDELDLERLDKDEFEDVMNAFAPQEDMRIFGRGIRRRLAPMLDDDPRRLQLAYSLLYTLPGSPVLLYGDEIAMGDDLSRERRKSVRLLMQWSSEHNGGFSSVPASELTYPPVPDGPWGSKARNVTAQRLDSASFLNWVVRLHAAWHDCPELGQGTAEIVPSSDARIFAHRCRLGSRFLLAVHNLGDEEVDVALELVEEDTHFLLELFADASYKPWKPGRKRIKLNPYGYRWFRRTKFRKE